MLILHVPLWALVPPLFILHTLVTLAAGQAFPASPSDPHGGVAMGESNAVCDDAEANIEIDWNPKSKKEYTCTEGIRENNKVVLHYSHCDQFAQAPLHICYPRAINYTEDLPTSGSHRPLWPKYGEYLYLPVQRWLHNLEHGGVAFLYHPCADPEQIQIFKTIAQSCLRRHVISPYKKMPPEMNFALLTWKCKLVTSKVDMQLMVNFVQTRALKGPEQTSRDGQYKVGLLQPSKVVSDLDDSELCPSMSVMSSTVENFNQKSLWRKIKSQNSQENLVKIMNSFMKQIMV